jgi:hypothetical protein
MTTSTIWLSAMPEGATAAPFMFQRLMRTSTSAGRHWMLSTRFPASAISVVYVCVCPELLFHVMLVGFQVNSYVFPPGLSVFPGPVKNRLM